MNDDYLWDPRARVDPEIASLEARLRPFAYAGPAGRRRRPNLLALAAAAALVAAAFALTGPSAMRPDSPYRIEALEGTVDAGPLHPGARIVLDSSTRARLHVGAIGTVDVLPETRLRVEDVAKFDDAEFGLYLERGTIEASIFAAPRLFQVGTPSGIAVDLGCVYHATVEDDGRTWLRVVLGQVSFEANGRKVYVPSGAECEARPHRGPGTPFWADHDAGYKQAVRRIDRGGAVDADAVATIVSTDDPRDTLTLWHLLADERSAVSGPALERLMTLIDVDPAIDRAALAARDPHAIEELLVDLEWRW